jgi:hypothetical protein
MYREITIDSYNVLDPEWDEVSRIIDFSNCWDNDEPTGDNDHPVRIGYDPDKRWFTPIVAPLQKLKPRPQPKPQPIVSGRQKVPQPIVPDRQKVLWWRHEMQEISEEYLAQLYNLDPTELHQALEDEWAVIYEFWGGTREEFRAEMRKPENIDKRRA